MGEVAPALAGVSSRCSRWKVGVISLPTPMKSLQIWLSIDDPRDLRELADRLNKLRMTPYDELAKLPEVSSETIDAERHFSIFRNKLADETIEIVLQMYIPGRDLWLVKFAQVFAEGFRLNQKGERLELPAEVLYGYM